MLPSHRAGRQMYCAIDADGRLVCWGRRLYGMGEPPRGRYRALAIEW
ncbi:MAG: RCC1 domain-containing protein [Chloroflexota bacterium]